MPNQEGIERGKRYASSCNQERINKVYLFNPSWEGIPCSSFLEYIKSYESANTNSFSYDWRYQQGMLVHPFLNTSRAMKYKHQYLLVCLKVPTRYTCSTLLEKAYLVHFFFNTSWALLVLKPPSYIWQIYCCIYFKFWIKPLFLLTFYLLLHIGNCEFTLLIFSPIQGTPAALLPALSLPGLCFCSFLSLLCSHWLLLCSPPIFYLLHSPSLRVAFPGSFFSLGPSSSCAPLLFECFTYCLSTVALWLCFFLLLLSTFAPFLLPWRFISSPALPFSSFSFLFGLPHPFPAFSHLKIYFFFAHTNCQAHRFQNED